MTADELRYVHKTSFQYDNSVRYCGIPQPVWLDIPSGKIHVEKGFVVCGWCQRLDERLMIGREGQIGILLFHPEYGEVWEHYPWYETDDGPLLKSCFRNGTQFLDEDAQ